MATCKWCGDSGWLVIVTPNGLCSKCNSVVGMDVNQRKRIMDDCIKLVHESSKLETRLSRLDLLLEHAHALSEYEMRGIPTIDPPPSAVLSQYEGMHDEIVLDSLQQQTQTAMSKSEAATTTRTKLSPLEKALAKVRDYQRQMNNLPSLLSLQAEIVTLMHTIQLDDYLEKATKAEFKGQRKKAVDQYYEALYFLRTDVIDDSLQKAHISAIEAKIVELGGELPTTTVAEEIEVSLDEAEEQQEHLGAEGRLKQGRAYVRKCRERGRSDEAIAKALEDAGWKPHDIADLLTA